MKITRRKMKITRRTTISVKTVRQSYERQSSETEIIYCERCAERMISVQTFTDVFGFSSRIIYRLIESDKTHFVETEANEIYVCPISVRQALELVRAAD